MSTDDNKEKADAASALALAALMHSMYTPIEIERRVFRAAFRKAEFDAHMKAGFTEMQALILCAKLI